MALYSFRSVTVTPAASSTKTRILGSNSSRFSLIGFNLSAQSIFFAATGTAGVLDYYAVSVGGVFAPLAFRDYGTLIQQEIWASTTGGGTSCFFVEIFKQIGS